MRVSATAVVKAMTSCLTSASISLNAVDGKTGLGGDGFGGFGGDDAVFCQHGAGRRFHLKPAAVLVLFRPDAAHGGAGVAIDQERLLS